MSLSVFDLDVDTMPSQRPQRPTVCMGVGVSGGTQGCDGESASKPSSGCNEAGMEHQAGEGWSWCSKWQRYIHCETKVSLQWSPMELKRRGRCGRCKLMLLAGVDLHRDRCATKYEAIVGHVVTCH
jgi:hypothetical protein